MLVFQTWSALQRIDCLHHWETQVMENMTAPLQKACRCRTWNRWKCDYWDFGAGAPMNWNRKMSPFRKREIWRSCTVQYMKYQINGNIEWRSTNHQIDHSVVFRLEIVLLHSMGTFQNHRCLCYPLSELTPSLPLQFFWVTFQVAGMVSVTQNTGKCLAFFLSSAWQKYYHLF